MKNIMKILTVTLVFLILLSNLAYAEEDEITVRVRVKGRPHIEQAELDGYENITIYNTSGAEPQKIYQIDDELSILMDTYYDKYFNVLASSSNANYGPYHVILSDKYFNTFEEALAEISNLSSVAESGMYPYYNGENYMIGYGAFPNSLNAAVIIDKLSQNGIKAAVSETEKENILVYDGQNNIVFMYKNDYNIAFTSYNSDPNLNSEMIKIDSKPYRGMMAFNIINDSTMISINRVDIESYLYGVVPCESPSTWPLEQLKAQTLAARTYAANHLKPNAYYGYDLNDDVSSQVYGGYNKETAATNKAVDETKGEMIYYDGKLIDAVFHSTSGGSTENSENIWQYQIPYLRGVLDPYSNISPRTVWQKTYTKDQIVERLKLYNYSVNDLFDIKITKVSDNNRALECIFYTDKGEIKVYKDSIRSVLGVDSSWLTVNHDKESDNSFYLAQASTTAIPSRSADSTESFTVDHTLVNKYIISASGKTKITEDNFYTISSEGKTEYTNASSDPNVYVIDGRGWGHSLGMSQYGAKQMATEGYTYDEIIKHYYTGVTIK